MLLLGKSSKRDPVYFFLGGGVILSVFLRHVREKWPQILKILAYFMVRIYRLYLHKYLSRVHLGDLFSWTLWKCHTRIFHIHFRAIPSIDP